MRPSRTRVHGHSLRDRLLYEYAYGPASAADLARRLDQPVNLVSHHTHVLLENGFLELVGTERRRGGTARIYRALVESVIEDDDWELLSGTVRRMLVRGMLAAVGDASREAALRGGFDAATAHISRWPLRLDHPARGEAATLLRRLLDDLDAIQAAADRRASPRRRRIDVVVMGFRPEPGE